MSGPLPGFLGPITWPMSWVYGWAIARRNARFDRGQGVQRLDLPVISVGNLTTGGVGKSPMVAWIARQLMRQECHPVIAMRGYGARDGDSGDEAAEYRRLLPDSHVVANPDRVAALRQHLLEHRDVKCIILDDGFQHRMIHRDVDLVLIDATAGTFSDRLLPAGNLREPLMNLKRAHAVIVTRAMSIDSGLSQLIEQHHGKPPIAWARHQWTHLDVHDSDVRPDREDLAWLRGKRLLTMCGVGNPAAVRREAESHGAIIAADVPARDHERFSAAKIALAREGSRSCDAMLLTMKDMVRLRAEDLRAWPAPVVVPRLEMGFLAGEEPLRSLILEAITANVPVR